ncbi:branched-chain amino acid ABC transporter permease [Microbispora cellulosiformans]|uniref:Branched-chain amino acid ABC transporter permease n=1 Tax=Microbispora cellulosiformans TaxID=2614688 RepID=A0A5J5K8T3_9ACTN|nr:branched-chain amino acid ABC transporter permease [Microbispora cellulosiformans]KAA9380819.1 branched-chain amino acid ABC transporter permease [Microbispora cellulosiformans]
MSAMGNARAWSGWTLYAIVLFVLPMVFTDPHTRLLLILITMYGMLAQGWNLTLGFAGIFNFAQIAFFGVGAYTAGILATRTGIDPWLALPISGVSAVLASLVAFLPVLRLRGIYVGLATYVFSQLCIYLVLGQAGLTGGSNGIVGIPRLTLGETSLRADGRVGYYYLGAALLFAATLLVRLITRSTLGLSLLAIRDNEALATSRGVSRVRQHLIVFMIGAAVAGVAGGFNAFLNGVVSTDVFGFGYLTLLLSMIFLGGSGSVYGPIAGAVVVTVVADALQDAGAWRDIAIAMLILVVLWVAPKGLAGLARSLPIPPLRRAGAAAPTPTTVKEKR